jgi:hypothetical protein
MLGIGCQGALGSLQGVKELGQNDKVKLGQQLLLLMQVTS